MEDFIVCRCEDVTYEQVRACADGTGTVDIAEAKRRLRVGMGICQGRTCGPLLERRLDSLGTGTLDRNTVVRPVLLADIASVPLDEENR